MTVVGGMWKGKVSKEGGVGEDAEGLTPWLRICRENVAYLYQLPTAISTTTVGQIDESRAESMVSRIEEHKCSSSCDRSFEGMLLQLWCDRSEVVV